MAIGNLSFKNPAWYHALVLTGAAGLLACVPLSVVGISKQSLMLFFSGLFFIGIGEWINHPLKITENRTERHISIHQTYDRNPCGMGRMFELLGFVLFMPAVYQYAAYCAA
jgi:hypothetical protein